MKTVNELRPIENLVKRAYNRGQYRLIENLNKPFDPYNPELGYSWKFADASGGKTLYNVVRKKLASGYKTESKVSNPASFITPEKNPDPGKLVPTKEIILSAHKLYFNLQDNTYVEYSSTSEYENLGIAKHGEDFFAATEENSFKFVYEEDREYFVEMLTKENILKTIEESGILIINYRMVIDEKLVYVGLRGVLVDDNEGQRLVIGISNIDSQVRRDQDYGNKNT